MLLREFSKIINRRYPVSASGREILASSLFIAVMGYFFLVVFQPFGGYTYSHKFKNLMMVPYALIAFVVHSAANIIFRKRHNRWNLSNELSKLFGVLIVCSGLNYVYNIYFINHVSFSIIHLLYMCLYTFAIAVPVSIIYILARYLYLSVHRNFRDETTPVPQPGRILTITPDAGPDVLEVHEDDFLFAESDGNYTTIHYLQNGNLNTQLLRLSLKNLEAQLGSGSIIRCHRSFIVNTVRVAKMKGNAQGYKLFIAGTETFVPVSRNNIAKMKKKLKAL